MERQAGREGAAGLGICNNNNNNNNNKNNNNNNNNKTRGRRAWGAGRIGRKRTIMLNIR